MKVLKVLLIASCCVFTQMMPLEAKGWSRVKDFFGVQDKPKPPTIKVLIGRDLDGAMIEVQGRYNIYDPFKGRKLASRFVGKSNYMQPLMNGLKWGEAFPGVYQVAIIPDQPSTTTLVDGIQYKGSVYVYQHERGVSIVNEVGIEDYVSSILASDLDETLSEEVKAAVVIAARSDAYYQALHSGNQYWNVDADKVGYQGYAVTHQGNGIEEAMKTTKYLVLTPQKDYANRVAPIQTRWIGGSAKKWDLSSAENMARRGEHAAKILNRFYPDTAIRLLNSFE